MCISKVDVPLKSGEGYIYGRKEPVTEIDSEGHVTTGRHHFRP